MACAARAAEFEFTASSVTLDNQLNFSSAAYFNPIGQPTSPSAATSYGASAGGLYFDGTHYNVWLPGTSQWMQVSTGAAGSTPPGGNNTYVQFNNNGNFGGSSNLTWSGTALGVTGVINASSAAVCRRGKRRRVVG